MPVAERPLLDRWILSRLARTIETCNAELSRYDATERRPPDRARSSTTCRTGTSAARVAGSGIRTAPAGSDTRAAFLTLHDCLVTLAQLLAPFTPFVAEELWRNLAAGRDGGARLGPPLRLSRRPPRRSVTVELDGAMAPAPRDRRARSPGPDRDEDPGPSAPPGGRRPHPGAARAARAAPGAGRRGAEREAGGLRGPVGAPRPLAGQAELQGARAQARIGGA